MAMRWYVPSFGYPVTRPYPYKWFPWVVLIGGIFSLVLFSAINLAANGYELRVQYTADPNSTVISQSQWAKRWPFSWFSKFETTCQSQTLQINSQFFTDKLTLPYTLTGVWQNRRTAENESNETVIPSLRYTNNVLENCTVPEMVISLDHNPDSSVLWSAIAKVYIRCSINNDDTPTRFNLTTVYPNFQPSFLHVDNQTKASLWWGRSLLVSSYERLIAAIYNQTLHSIDNSTTENLVRGIFWVESDEPFLEKGPISSPSFFFEAYSMTCAKNDNQHECSDTTNIKPGYLEYWPNIFPEADRYAKVLYSTILADLGSSSLDKILINASLLQEYTKDYDYQIQSYNELKDSGMGPLEITPSNLYAEYFCQVPQRKPVGPLIVAIFVADLVFLQVVYKMLTWTTTAWTERNNQQAKFCEGCLANMERGPYELSLAAPTDAAQESLPVSSETLGRLARSSMRERHRSLESQQPLVLSSGLSE